MESAFDETANKNGAKPRIRGTAGPGHLRTSTIVSVSKEQELQKLLAEERQRSEQRKLNYQALKEEHIKLQRDFITLQSEMKQILEETKSIKEKKENELEENNKLIVEKDKIIETMKKELVARNPEILKEKFADELREPLKRLEKEQVDLLRDKERMGFEIKMAKQKIEHLEKESIDSVERVKFAYEAEINLVRKEKEELRLKILELSQTPDGQKLSMMAQENAKLTTKLRGFQTTLEETELQYKKMQNKLETILADQEKTEEDHDKEVEHLKSLVNNLKEINYRQEDQLKVYEREREEFERDRVRSEKEGQRLKKENSDLEKRFHDDQEKIKRTHIRDKITLEKQNELIAEEIKKLKLDLDSKTEAAIKLEQVNASLVKDHQLQVAVIRQQEWEKKNALERDKTSLEVKLKENKEEKTKLKEEIEQLKRQIENGMEQRMGIEKDLLVLRAKSESMQTNQDELDKLRRQNSVLHDEMNKLKSENLEALVMNKELERQKERYREEFERMKHDLDEERRELADYKLASDRNLMRLRTCLDEERTEMREKIDELERESIKRKQDKEEMRLKYKQYVAIAEKLQTKLKEMKERQKLLEKYYEKHSSQAVAKGHSSQTVAKGFELSRESVPLDAHNQLRKQYKDLKKKQSELSSLLNCSFDSAECKPNHNT